MNFSQANAVESFVRDLLCGGVVHHTAVGPGFAGRHGAVSGTGWHYLARQDLPRRPSEVLVDAHPREPGERMTPSIAEHQEKTLKAYLSFDDEGGFAAVATADEILANEGNLSIPRYVNPLVRNTGGAPERDHAAVWPQFESTGSEFWQQVDEGIATLDALTTEGPGDG